MKNLSILKYWLILLVFHACTTHPAAEKPKGKYIILDGYIQGTTFHIVYLSRDGKDYREGIDSLLTSFNRTASIYDTASIISRINRNEPDVVVNDIFREIFSRSMQISGITDGLFDITVGQVVNAWGFGPDTVEKDANLNIDSLIEFVGYHKVRLENDKIIKQNSGVMLDFNAIAQGYSVDLVSKFFESRGLNNYLVEIGGEVYCRGLKNNETEWRIGVDKPVEGNYIAGEDIQTIIRLTDKALATSGNYRKFYMKDGVKYSHSINPKTGYPARHNLLSATVIADDCMTADAYATAFMVMGLEESIAFLKKHPELEALLIYSRQNNDFAVYQTQGMERRIDGN